MGRRIVTTSAATAKGGINERGIRGTAAPADDYSSRLVKYIPAEIITAFVTMNGMVASSDKKWLQWVVFGALLILTPLYTHYLTREPGMPPAKKQIAVSSVSYLLWVFAIGGPFVLTTWYDHIYGSLLLPLFTFVVPMLDQSGAQTFTNNQGQG